MRIEEKTQSLYNLETKMCMIELKSLFSYQYGVVMMWNKILKFRKSVWVRDF